MSETIYNNEELSRLEQELKKNPSAPASYVNLIKAQLSLNKKQHAFSTYRAAKVICPDDPGIMYIGSKVLESLGKKEEAIESLLKAVESGDNTSCNSDSISHLAELLYNSGKKDEALAWLNKLATTSDEKPEVLIRIAQIHISLGNIDEAQNYLSKYRKKAGVTREMYLLMGETMITRGFFDGGVKNYSEAVLAFPEDPDMHLGLGKSWLGMGEKASALKELSKAVTYRPKDINILLELGKLQNELGMRQEADESFAKIENSKFQNGECLLDMAKHFIGQQNDFRALNYLESARKLSPFHPEILRVLGETNLKLGRFEEALEVFTAAASSEPDAIWAQEGSVKSAEAIGRYSVKAEAQKKLLSLKNSSAEDWCDYGETLIKLNQFELAQEAYDTAAKLDPTCLRAYEAPEKIRIEKARSAGEKFARQGEEALEKRFYMTAIERLEKALALLPNNEKWIKTLAKISIKTADFEKASELLAKVRLSEPGNVEVAYQLARTYEFLEKYDMAISLLNEILKMKPEDFKAHLTLLRLKRCQIRGATATMENIDSVVKKAVSDLEFLGKASIIPLLVKGYANYIFYFRTERQVEGLKRAESAFNELLNSFGEIPEAVYGLALCERTKGNLEKAVEHIKTYISLFPDFEKNLELARLYENFRKYDKARETYLKLREAFPENGYYRRKFVETTALLQNETGKNQLTLLLSEAHKQIVANAGSSIWAVYESAIGQEMASRSGNLSSEWLKRSMLNWHKAESSNDVNHWVIDGMIRCRLKNLTGIDKVKIAASLKKIGERNLREMPDWAGSYLALARCYLAFNDLTNMDKGLDFLKKAWFIDQSSTEVGKILAETAKNLGKSLIVDVVGYNVILSEPEIANDVFKFQ